MELRQQLENFEKEYLRGEINALNISARFKKIAETILYGGYIDVYGEFRVYARTLEFYFHEEEGSIKDPIVYHRNGKYGDRLRNPPYFPIMSLHAHMSGFDITFESKEGKYRASALIRKYSVYENNEARTPIVENATQSTYLYDYLNGFSLDSEKRILWRAESFEGSTEVSGGCKRKNVYVGKKWKEEKGLYDYEWSFSAIDL